MPEDGKLDLIALRRLRGTIKSSLTTTQNWLNSMKEKSVTELKRRNDYISGKLNEFYDLQNKIYLLDENESDEYATTMEEMYFHITSRIDELIEEATCTTGNDNASISSESPSDSVKSSKNIRLSKLPLPEFDGKIEEWTSFYQRFTNAMNRKDLSDIYRIQYLMSCVKGDAALVIKNIAIIGENYTGALDLLQKRYDNKRINVRLFLQSLFNLPSVSVNSASSLREILNKVIVNVRALENLDYQRDKLSNELLVQLIVSKLDSKTREGWELQLSTLDSNVDDERDSYGELISFLEDRLQVLLSVYPTTSSTNAIKEGPKSRGQKTTLAVTSTPERSARMVRACSMCKKGHSLYACEDFRKLTIPQRYDKVKSLKLCVNCFGSKHWANQCTAGRCKECTGLHHTLLHQVEPETPTLGKQITAPPAAGNASSPTVVSTVTQQSLRDVLLATAIVTVSSPSATCRAVAMLDGASHASFIINRLRYQLQAPVFNTATIISGFGGKTSKASTTTKIQIASRNGECLIDVSALVSEKITDPLPTQSFDLTEAWNFISDYDLADPEFNERKDIDILIGADVLYDILLPEFHKRENAPTLQSSLLGWLVIGPYAALSFQPQVHCNLTTTQFNQISDFWELQDPPSISQRAECANKCDTHFRENYSRVNGRFQVRLPFRDDQRPATTRQQALARFKRMTFSEKYQEFMYQYESLGHMRLVPADESQLTESYYIPHHGIERDDKLRVVFDGSMKSSNGLSLNDCLQVGPTIQPTIFEVLLRFRTHQFVFTTDISKMYRQIMLYEADQRWQRIFWFHNDEVAEFQLTTVTYGTASAPYSAIRCLFQLAEDGRTTHPRAATILEKNCYVDDILAGSDTLDEAIELRNELCDLLGTAGMELGKWRANTTALLPETVKNEDVPLLPSSIGKTLGVEWNSTDDTLRSPSYSNLPNAPITKRSALSMLVRVFDPLGLLAPITVTGKLLIQELWTENVSWDDPVTPEFSKQFQKFLQSLQAASNMSFPRHIGWSNASSIELHAFADASARAYATCIYACIEHPNGSRTSTLLCAKTRVAPTRAKRTIPELELCAATLLVETLEPVATVLNIPLETCYAYSDSTVVLSYLARDPSHWRPFVANRVQKIIHKIPARKWRHIPDECNPADIATRHRAASEFESRFELWSKGPEILCLNNDESTFHDWTPDESALTYLRSIKTTLATTVVHDINANWVETFFQ